MAIIKCFSKTVAAIFAVGLLFGINCTNVNAAEFDPAFYAITYPDVTAAFGTDPQALLNHYILYGMSEGRYPSATAAPGEEVDGILITVTASTEPILLQPGPVPSSKQQTDGIFQPVPIGQLANYSSLKRYMSDEEFALAYQAALNVVAPLAGLPVEEQMRGIMVTLNEMFWNEMSYSTSAPHYNDPYGYLILKTASCAGSTRTAGLCLNILGIPYEHINENKWTHQWCRVNVNGTYWIVDPYGPYCGPEPAPYTHPRGYVKID